LISALGGENLVLNTLKEAESQEDMTNKLSEQVQVGWLITTAMPIVVSFVVLVFYFFCCWSCFPCCRCCRCFAKERETSLLAKAILALMLALCFAGILYGGVQTLKGFDTCRSGFDDMACSSTKLLETTLSGQSSPYFIGMMPVFDKMWTLDQQFEDNSQMLTDLDAILNSTVGIQDAVTVASGTIKLLGDMLALSGNVNPVSALDEDLKHDCEFCKQLASPLGAVADVMQSSVGTALAAARAEVKNVLSPGARRDLQETLRSASEPLVTFKESVRNTFGGFVEPGKIESLREAIDFYLKPVLSFFFFCAILLFSFACLSASCFATCEKTSKGTYNRHPHRLAGCVWCCAVFLVFPVLLLGGLMMAVSVPLAGICMTMAPINKQTLTDIAPAIGMNMSGDNGVILSGIVDQCISTTNTSSNANLMDIVFTRDATTGEVTYVRQQIVSTVKDPLDQAFAGIDAAQAGGSISLSTSSEILALRNLISGNPVDAMMLPDAAKIRADNSLQPMLSEQDLSIALLTSTRCSNFTVVGDLGSFSGQAMPGMANFVDKLKAYGTEIPSSSCLANVACTPGATASACNAGNEFVNLKRKLTDSTANLFRCDIFEDSNGVACDPINMVQDSDGQWQNDCLVVDGSDRLMKVFQRTCNLEEFVAYVQGFDQRIANTLSRLDTVTAGTMTGITMDLRGLVNTYVLNPVLGIVDGITCGFMPTVYREVVDGMCYQGVVGFRTIGKSYVIVSVSVLLLALVMYVLWRRVVDNTNAEVRRGARSSEEQPEKEDEPERQKPDQASEKQEDDAGIHTQV